MEEAAENGSKWEVEWIPIHFYMYLKRKWIHIFLGYLPYLRFVHWSSSIILLRLSFQEWVARKVHNLYTWYKWANRNYSARKGVSRNRRIIFFSFHTYELDAHSSMQFESKHVRTLIIRTHYFNENTSARIKPTNCKRKRTNLPYDCPLKREHEIRSCRPTSSLHYDIKFWMFYWFQHSLRRTLVADRLYLKHKCRCICRLRENSRNLPLSRVITIWKIKNKKWNVEDQTYCFVTLCEKKISNNERFTKRSKTTLWNWKHSKWKLLCPLIFGTHLLMKLYRVDICISKLAEQYVKNVYMFVSSPIFEPDSTHIRIFTWLWTCTRRFDHCIS